MAQRTRPHRSAGMPLKGLRVEVLRGPDAGRTFVAEGAIVTIGSDPSNDLALTDATVSRHHLELRRHADRIVVVDHGSTNGTALGTALIERATLAPDTTLTLGKTTIRIDDGETVTVELHEDERLGGIYGRTPEMRGLMARIARAAQNQVSVLVLGETGTGKELIAQAIHAASPRARAPFETVDCGALLPTLIASELFGHERGAFTGAEQRHIGAFERADGGTLFLDEVGELPAALQVALLGALERRSFRRLGGQKPISVDVRVVCATNRDLRAEVNAGTFRQDLYFRIAVLLLRVPALRERPGDIPLLVEHFLREAGYQGDVEDIVPEAAMKGLRTHHWPGNVRELRNFVETAVAMGEAPPIEGARATDGDPSAPEDETASETQPPPSASPDAPAHEDAAAADRYADVRGLPYSEARAAVLRGFEASYLGHLMARAGGNVSKASREAKMNRSHLIELLKRHKNA